METITNFILVQHPTLCYVAFSAIVSTMPEVDANTNKGYLWLYRVLHLAAANMDKVFHASNAAAVK